MPPMPSRSGADAIWRRASQDALCEQDAGASPFFPPAGLDEELAQADIVHAVHRSPRLLGVDRSSWTLASLRRVIGWLSKASLTTVSHYLHRFRLSYKRGRAHVHSPDPLYDQKLEAIAQARDLAVQAPEDVIFRYEDEHSLNLRPTVGRSSSLQGEPGAKAPGSTSQLIRLAGVVDVASGQVLVRRRSKFTVEQMYRFFYHVEQHYPQASLISIALDNWPVHFHPYVQERLTQRGSKIRLLSLPTYSPWTNPLAKFWLKLTREFTDQHPFGCDLATFREELHLWLDKHRQEAAALLHELGLLPTGGLVVPD